VRWITKSPLQSKLLRRSPLEAAFFFDRENSVWRKSTALDAHTSGLRKLPSQGLACWIARDALDDADPPRASNT
jgi:hypothetical protein